MCDDVPAPHERDELLQVLRRRFQRHGQHAGAARDHRHRREVLQRVIGKLVHHRRLLDQRGDRNQDCVAVSRGLRHESVADRSARAGLVLDDHGLVPCFLQLLGDGARECVRRAAGRIRHDELDRLVRVRGVLRERGCAEQDSGRGEAQAAQQGRVIHREVSVGC
jgi:hypothetical protein